jgi:dephospho-CoA kinase
MRELLSKSVGVPSPVFIEVPLLIETATHQWFDEVWVCDAGDEARWRRLLDRLGGDQESARRLLATQLPTKAKIPFADRIIRTDRPFESVMILTAKLAGEVARRL